VMQALALLEWERGRVEEAHALFTRAIALKPWDGGLYQTYGLLQQKKGNVPAARALFKEGSLAAKGHPALWQTWALMEADCGKVEVARSLFQQGVWGAGASPKAHTLWRAWGLLEAKLDNLEDARKYLARAVDLADRPADAFVAWALVEERQGQIGKTRDLMEKAVAAEPANPVVWAAYLRFARRVFGEASPEAQDIYQRTVVAEIRTRSDREEAFPPQMLSQQDSRRQGAPPPQFAQGAAGDIFVGDNVDVLMKAKWGSARQGSGSGWPVPEGSP